MPRRRTQPPSSDSDSDASTERGRQLTAKLYAALQLAAALRRPADYAAAAAELAALLRHVYAAAAKPCQAAMAADAELAVDACDG